MALFGGSGWLRTARALILFLARICCSSGMFLGTGGYNEDIEAVGYEDRGRARGSRPGRLQGARGKGCRDVAKALGGGWHGGECTSLPRGTIEHIDVQQALVFHGIPWGG